MVKLIESARKNAVHRPVRPTPPSRTTKQLTSTQNAAIAASYESGKSVTELAAEFGVTTGTIHHRLNIAGVERRPIGMTTTAVQEAISLRATGMPIYKISRLVGYAQGTVANELRRADAYRFA